MVDLGFTSCNRCGGMIVKTFLGAKACFASFVKQSAQVWVLDLLRFLVVQLRHHLTEDGPSDYLLTICIILRKFPRGPELLNMSTR